MSQVPITLDFIHSYPFSHASPFEGSSREEKYLKKLLKELEDSINIQLLIQPAANSNRRKDRPDEISKEKIYYENRVFELVVS